MDIILIPGFWLDASSWDDIVPALREEGHRVRALTLPGMESKDADRSEITLRDHRQRLSDERRYDVPATVIACEFSSAQLREWMAQDHLAWRELPKVRDVGYIDLPTGRWPQLIKSGEPGRAILASVAPPEEMTRL